MKEIEEIYKCQDRWNDEYGKLNMVAIHKNPAKYFVDPCKLSKQKLDMIEAMRSKEQKQILELGSGRGEFSVALAKMGGIVTGVDIGVDLVNLAKEVAVVNRVKCDFVVGSIIELPFQEGTFDYVVGNAILHHLPRIGVLHSLKESYRVLKPGGIALFTEPIENSKVFDFIQNLIPLEKPGSPQYRPSILQKTKWKLHLKAADDRALSNAELMDAKGDFKKVEFKYYGFIIRLTRLYPNRTFQRMLESIDNILTHRYSPVKKLSQSVLVTYKK